MCFWFVCDEIEADITENDQDKIENVYNSLRPMTVPAKLKKKVSPH